MNPNIVFDMDVLLSNVEYFMEGIQGIYLWFFGLLSIALIVLLVFRIGRKF